MLNYRLQDPIYVKSLLSGIEGVNDILGLEGYLVGGGAIQYYTSDPELRRPTLDVDIQSRDYIPGSTRNIWARNVLRHLEERNLSGIVTGIKRKSGAEVTLATPDDPLFIHLDIYTGSYIREHESQISESFERSRKLNLGGTKEGHTYLVEAPEDVSSFKLRRLVMALGSSRLSAEDQRRVQLICSGLLDDIEVGDLENRLGETIRLRKMTIEEITRDGFERASKYVERFKDLKNMYDLLVLIHSHRQRKIFDDFNIIKKTVRSYDRILSRVKVSPFV